LNIKFAARVMTTMWAKACPPSLEMNICFLLWEAQF
jgi:hypothetical protein